MIAAVAMFMMLAASACLLFAGSSAVREVAVRKPGLVRPARQAGPKPTEAESLPRLVRQMASLLAAGRSGPQLWATLAQVLAAEPQSGGDGRWRWRRQPRRTAPVNAVGRSHVGNGAAGNSTAGNDDVGNAATVHLLLVVQRATAMGLSSATAIRCACSENPRTGRESRHRPMLTSGQRSVWLETAACFEVCEASGAPVAAVLNRLANAIESDFDAAALRETALAGPRATVRLLGWLPFIGLGLGMAMGVDPLAVLFGSPLGWAVLFAGLAFTVAGRLWSTALIAHAAHPSGKGARRAAGNGQSVGSSTRKMR